MNNSIIVPEDKDFVCAFATSPNSFYEAIESYRNYVRSSPRDRVRARLSLFIVFYSGQW